MGAHGQHRLVAAVVADKKQQKSDGSCGFRYCGAGESEAVESSKLSTTWTDMDDDQDRVSD